MMKKIVMVGMLLLAACAPALVEPTPTTPSTPEEPTEVVTATPTMEPTSSPTEAIVEVEDTESQTWWLEYWEEAEKVAAKTEGCEISYEIVNAREFDYVNLIPWTVDQNGEAVQSVIPSFCGTGAYWAIGLNEDYEFFVNQILSDGHKSYLLGPEYVAYGYDPNYVRYVGLDPGYLGGLTQEEIIEMRSRFGAYPPVLIVEASWQFLEPLVRFRFGRTQ
jgi:hypothetical protein